MSKRLYFLIYPVLVLILSSISYGAPGNIRLDFDYRGDVNTQPGFTSFLISDSSETVNGITIYLSGTINDNRRSNPSDPEYPIPYGEIYRDFIYGVSPSGVTITLFGLGANQSCKINLYAYDAQIEPTRAADWYANGTFMFTADFNGGMLNWPDDITDYNNTATVTADAYGRIILTSTRNPSSPAGQVFAVVNALLVTPQGTYVQPDYAMNPQPVVDKTEVPLDAVLSWTGGGNSTVHDVYLGTDEAKVTDANRSNPLGVLVSENQSITTYTPPDLLDLSKIYYWRIDEVNTSCPNSPWKGLVWSFTTSTSFVIEKFDSYADNSALRDVWKNGGTSAEVSVETATVRDGNSMRYLFDDNLPPYYSEASADVNTARPNGLGKDPNWLGIGAKTLVLWFYGQAGNDINKPMYVKLTDGDVSPHTAQVNYDGDMNDLREESWHEWNVYLQDFVDSNSVNLANVKTITIGFGDGTQAANDGIVYFDDIQLYKRKRICPIDIYAGDLNGDCVVDYRDLKMITDNWLADCTAPDNCGDADFVPTDGIVNIFDFSGFAMQWLWYNDPPLCDEGFTVPPMPSFSSLPTNSYLPDPFRFMNGSRMTTKASWTCRRAEIAALVQEFELGYMQYTPYSATTGAKSGNAIVVTVNDNSKTISFTCSISYPSTGSAPYPAMIGVGFSSLNNSVLSSLGVAVITFPCDQIAEQINQSSRGKGKFYDMYGSGHSAGALMAWAWGMDRLIDAIEKTPACNIDPNRLGVTGCSRWGKGALVCGAFDERIKLTIPQESGSGGAASWRVSDWQGTSVQTLCQIVGENVWLRANFNQFCNNTNKLPFDHHMVEGLCAPRALLVIENSSQVWLGNVSTWTTGNVAHKIWEALGIPDKMGYSSDGTHSHCVFPSAQQPEVTAYVQKFLVGGGTGNTNVMKCDGGVIYNESQWVNWTIPPLE